MLGPERYATARAREQAGALGLNISLATWRAVFLAVTAAVLREPSDAAYVGPLRDGERWTVRIGGRVVDVLYDPAAAVVVGVADARQWRKAA